MADAFNILKWDNIATSVIGSYGSTTGYVVFKDEDANDPGRVKRVYGARITYKIGGTVAKTSGISYALDGNTTFITTAVPAGNLNNTASIWNKDDVLFSTIQSAQSWRFKVSFGTSASGIYELNDFTVEARPIYRRVT